MRTYKLIMRGALNRAHLNKNYEYCWRGLVSRRPLPEGVCETQIQTRRCCWRWPGILGVAGTMMVSTIGWDHMTSNGNAWEQTIDIHSLQGNRSVRPASSCKRKYHYLEEHPYHWIGVKVSVVGVSYSTGVLSASTITERIRHPTLVRLAARKTTGVKI